MLKPRHFNEVLHSVPRVSISKKCVSDIILHLCANIRVYLQYFSINNVNLGNNWVAMWSTELFVQNYCENIYCYFFGMKFNFTTVNIIDHNSHKLMPQDFLSSWLPKSWLSSTILGVCSLFCVLCTTASNSTMVSCDTQAKSWTLHTKIV